MKKIFSWKVLRWALIGVVLILVVMQFVPVDRSNPPVETEVPAPANVRAVLQQSCFDCHSNQTIWPWYSRVAPFSWLVAHDVNEARKEMNFSTWNRYSTQQQAKKVHECWEEVEEGEMPLWYYLLAHRDAVLSTEDRALLRQWGTSGEHSDRSSGKELLALSAPGVHTDTYENALEH